jgi:Fur family transcriptional regulator, peroxide stress response regulator
VKNVTRDIESLGLTKQRQVVLQVIRDSSEHLTANEVFENARQILPRISFATVYNSLRYLREEGHIGEIRFGNDASRYDRKLSRHDHAICIECDKLVDIELEMPPELVAEATAYSGFYPETIELTLRGLCPDCNNNTFIKQLKEKL